MALAVSSLPFDQIKSNVLAWLSGRCSADFLSHETKTLLIDVNVWNLQAARQAACCCPFTLSSPKTEKTAIRSCVVSASFGFSQRVEVEGYLWTRFRLQTGRNSGPLACVTHRTFTPNRYTRETNQNTEQVQVICRFTMEVHCAKFVRLFEPVDPGEIISTCSRSQMIRENVGNSCTVFRHLIISGGVFGTLFEGYSRTTLETLTHFSCSRNSSRKWTETKNRAIVL